MDPAVLNFLYSLIQTLHNLARWFVVVFAALALVRAYRGWLKKGEWVKLDDRAGVIFTSLMDTQILLGLILYFLFSPWSQLVFKDFGQARANPNALFFGLEHAVLMVLAVVAAHVGRALSRKAQQAAAKHRAAAIWFSLAVVLLLAGIPWPFLQYGRPWFRLLGIIF